MTHSAIAQTIHDGSGRLPGWRRELIAEWLTAHGIRPKDVSADHPILILNMPYRDQSDEPSTEGQWAIQVVSFVQYIRNEEDDIAAHPGTGRPLTIQRTVPLQHAFPTDPTTDGEDHGEADREEAEQAAEEGFRDAQQAKISHNGQGSCSERVGQGVGSRNEGAEEGRSSSRDEAVPEPEEDKPEEAVTEPKDKA